jgi:hypothetical protein
MPMIDVYAAAGTPASKHDLAQQLAAAVMRRGQAPPIAHCPLREKRRSVMPTSTGSPIKTQIKKIDGLPARYAESEPRDVAAILLSPWPESLYAFEQMLSRLAGPNRVREVTRPAPAAHMLTGG